MFRYARRDLLRNPRRTLAALVGVVLGVGLFSSVLFFIDGSGASMTKRAVAPVTLDMQRVITAPYGERLMLEESLTPRGPLGAGAETLVKLTVRNKSAAPVNEVVVRDTTPDGFAYVPGSAILGRVPLPDVNGESPFGHGFAAIGYNAGTIAAGETVELTYRARARQAVPSTAAVRFRGSVSSRENLVPLPANQPRLVAQDALRKRIAAIPGVAAADELAFASLPPGSLSAGAVRVDRPIRVFGFTAAYAVHHPAIRLAAGSFERHAAVLSPEAADALGVWPGGSVSISLPGGARPIKLEVSGIADLSPVAYVSNAQRMCCARSGSIITVRISRPAMRSPTFKYPRGALLGVPPSFAFWRRPFMASAPRFWE